MKDLSPLFAAIPIAESSGSVETTVWGAAIIAAGIAITKLIDVWWSNRRKDGSQAKQEERADKDQVFRLQESFIQDLLIRTANLETGSKEKDLKIQTLEAQHHRCEEDHAESQELIKQLQGKLGEFQKQLNGK